MGTMFYHLGGEKTTGSLVVLLLADPHDRNVLVRRAQLRIDQASLERGERGGLDLCTSPS